MITLRQNQIEPINKAIRFFAQDKAYPSLIVLATAWGKSILTAFVAKNIEDKLLVLQPSKELLEQNYSKYLTLCGDLGNEAAIYSASLNRKEVAKITYATIGSIKNLGKNFKELGFTKMLIDEAHLYPREADSMLGKFLRESGISHVLGITATPVKLQTNRDMDMQTYSKLVMLTARSKKGNFYRDIIHVGQVQEMVQLGFWSRLKYEESGFDGSMLRFNSTKSEYTDESIGQAFAENGVSDAVIGALNSNLERKHILCFVPSVREAQELAEHYPNSGVVWGEMDKKSRAKTIQEFKAGNIRVLFNVSVLGTGFDYTGIDCVILGFSTASIARYYQFIGRATRIDPDKKDALIIDLGGNVRRFGKVEDIAYIKTHTWQMYGTNGRLLSGVPIHEISAIDEKPAKPIDPKDLLMEMPFGKHKGEMIADIPRSYRRWMLDKFEWTARNENLRQSILATL